MHDGQNLFDSATAFGAEWRVDETVASLVRSGRVEPVIVVGVSSRPDTRIDDYTPVPHPFERGGQRVPLGGKADAYGRFLVEELKPFVDANYRTRPDARDTALGGSSLGGLVSMYLGLRYPNVFSKLLVVSPSVWWANGHIVDEVEAAPSKHATRIWLDIGTAEGDEATQGARRLREALVAKGWRLGDDLAYMEVREARHDESAWAARFGRMLEFVFPRAARRPASSVDAGSSRRPSEKAEKGRSEALREQPAPQQLPENRHQRQTREHGASDEHLSQLRTHGASERQHVAPDRARARREAERDEDEDGGDNDE
jgi:predicted alpha/beta superfamily hydrolase